MKGLRSQNRMAQIVAILGRHPKNYKEYQRIYQLLYRDKYYSKEALRRQRQRHLNHTGPANITRGYCFFCER